MRTNTKVDANKILKHGMVGFFRNCLREFVEREREDAYNTGIEVGIEKTIAALYEADVDDDAIIRIVVDLWEIENKDAEKRLIEEKCQATIRALEHYLRLQGYSRKEIRQFMQENYVERKISNHKELWELRRNPRKIMCRVQEKRKTEG